MNILYYTDKGCFDKRLLPIKAPKGTATVQQMLKKIADYHCTQTS